MTTPTEKQNYSSFAFSSLNFCSSMTKMMHEIEWKKSKYFYYMNQIIGLAVAVQFMLNMFSTCLKAALFFLPLSIDLLYSSCCTLVLFLSPSISSKQTLYIILNQWWLQEFFLKVFLKKHNFLGCFINYKIINCYLA